MTHSRSLAVIATALRTTLCIVDTPSTQKQRGICSHRGQHARSRAQSTLGAPTGPGQSGGRATSRMAAPAFSTKRPDLSPAPRTAFCQRKKVNLVKIDQIPMILLAQELVGLQSQPTLTILQYQLQEIVQTMWYLSQYTTLRFHC